MEVFRQLTANNIELKEYRFIKELAMEAYLIENESILKLDDDNFSEVTILDAEIALKSGRKTSKQDGRLDILAKYGLDYLAVIELKLKEINEDTLIQLNDYLNEREQILLKNPDFWNDNENKPNWIGVLVGTSISPELQRKLQDGLINDDGIPIAGLVIKRYRSLENEIFVITDTFFKYNYKSKDFSKFQFNGKTYNKARLVNAVIKKYVELNPSISYAELENIFPQRLQGSVGVFTTKEKAQEIFNNTNHKRHYLKSDEFIKLSDAIIATSTQWGIKNIEPFIAHVHQTIKDFKIDNK